MSSAPVIPVITIEDLEHAVPLAEALVAGGLPLLEVTLRTPVALKAIRAMREGDGAIVGAGTVTNQAELERALDAGSEFIVSPGLTEPLGRAAIAAGVPFLPGVANAGDIMRGLDLGLTHFKFFPAMASGGLPALKALAAAFGQCRFCPTGGIGPDSAAEWLAFEPVLCVGGSWVSPKGAPDTSRIEALARREGAAVKPAADLVACHGKLHPDARDPAVQPGLPARSQPIARARERGDWPRPARGADRRARMRSAAEPRRAASRAHFARCRGRQSRGAGPAVSMAQSSRTSGDAGRTRSSMRCSAHTGYSCSRP